MAADRSTRRRKPICWTFISVWTLLFFPSGLRNFNPVQTVASSFEFCLHSLLRKRLKTRKRRKTNTFESEEDFWDDSSENWTALSILLCRPYHFHFQNVEGNILGCRHEWPQCIISLELSKFKFVLFAFLFSDILLLPRERWLPVSAAVTAGSLLEAWTSQIDNIILSPFLCSLLLFKCRWNTVFVNKFFHTHSRYWMKVIEGSCDKKMTFLSNKKITPDNLVPRILFRGWAPCWFDVWGEVTCTIAT